MKPDLCACGVPATQLPASHARITLDGVERCADINPDPPDFLAWRDLETLR